MTEKLIWFWTYDSDAREYRADIIRGAPPYDRVFLRQMDGGEWLLRVEMVTIAHIVIETHSFEYSSRIDAQSDLPRLLGELGWPSYSLCDSCKCGYL